MVSGENPERGMTPSGRRRGGRKGVVRAGSRSNYVGFTKRGLLCDLNTGEIEPELAQFMIGGCGNSHLLTNSEWLGGAYLLVCTFLG